eukprot:769697-Prorocentrum_minimum.AAC.2
MVEKNPWWNNVEGPFPAAYGCIGVKDDGGGSMRGRGLVGSMRIHRGPTPHPSCVESSPAVNNRDVMGIIAAVEAGDDVNEVEAVRAYVAHRCRACPVSQTWH